MDDDYKFEEDDDLFGDTVVPTDDDDDTDEDTPAAKRGSRFGMSIKTDPDSDEVLDDPLALEEDGEINENEYFNRDDI